MGFSEPSPEFEKRKSGSNKSVMERLLKIAPAPTATVAEADLAQGQILLADGMIVSLPAAEKFRILRAKIDRMNLGKKRYSVLAVTSAVPQEGKSVISVNLARALSLDPHGKTLVIDCDLRRPSVNQFFNFPRNPGLSDVLRGETDLNSVIRSVTPTLDVICAGTMAMDPTQLIEQPELAEYFNELKSIYRYIIVDCPPVLVCPEPISISSIVDSTLLVVRAWRTERRLVEDAIEVLGKNKILGLVVNDGSDASKAYLEYGYYGYRPNPA